MITIHDEKTVYQLPNLIEESFFDVLAVHGTSTWYNNLNIRVKGLRFEEGRLAINTERTYYLFSMVTNRAADYEWRQTGVSIRALYEPGPRLLPLEQSLLSNHLGFNGFIISCDGFIVFVKRGDNLSIGKRTYGDSIGASLKCKYALDQNGYFTPEYLANAILCEIEDELKLTRKDIGRVSIISAYRDCVECGKPQLLFCSESTDDAYTISHRFAEGINQKDGQISIPLDRREKLRRVQEKKVLIDGGTLVWIHLDQLGDVTFEPQGIRYSGTGNGFFEFDSLGKQITLSQQFLHMVPSASASVITLREHLTKLLR